MGETYVGTVYWIPLLVKSFQTTDHPLKVVSFAPCQLPSGWIWPRALKRKWKAGERKTIEHF